MENEFKEVMSERSDKELIKIVTNERDSYNPIAIKAAESEIDKRNIDTSKLQEIRENALKEKQLIDSKKDLEFCKQISRFWVYFGYVVLLFTGGIYGIIAGNKYLYSKRKTESGNDFFLYNKSSREEGKVMLIFGYIVLGIHIITRII